jgi:hypothetical protein
MRLREVTVGVLLLAAAVLLPKVAHLVTRAKRHFILRLRELNSWNMLGCWTARLGGLTSATTALPAHNPNTMHDEQLRLLQIRVYSGEAH